ncbi:MAG: sigma-70 family RNA polymerase sigma factor [Pirellulales bacterium]|nr:sigma-70 family RNA polymerase sigma factor [Pirellulales bacterium]
MSPEIADAELVERAQGGDRAAFGELVLRHQQRVFAALVGLLGCPEEARDAAQDAFVQAWRKLGAFRGEAQFATWLYRIAMNEGLTRRRRRRPTVSLDHQKEHAGAEPIDPAGDPTRTLAATEEAAHVRAALAEFPDDQRQILVLREMDGCSYDDIAEVLALPIGTVRSRLFRARMQLREMLQLKLDEPGSRRRDRSQTS